MRTSPEVPCLERPISPERTRAGTRKPEAERNKLVPHKPPEHIQPGQHSQLAGLHNQGLEHTQVAVAQFGDRSFARSICGRWHGNPVAG